MKNITEQENFWAKTYATEYIKKNTEFDSIAGEEAWKKMLFKTCDLEDILECGCNIGRNIDFLNKTHPFASKSIIEISKPAFDFVTSKFALKSSFNGSITNSKFNNNSFDLVFTMGVLIHIHPDDLIKNMQYIFEYSKKYILFGEYFNRTPEMIEYQGQKDKLFKRDFGRFFLDNFNVSVVDYGFLWGQVYDKAGFDDVTWWLFEKNPND